MPSSPGQWPPLGGPHAGIEIYLGGWGKGGGIYAKRVQLNIWRKKYAFFSQILETEVTQNKK